MVEGPIHNPEARAPGPEISPASATTLIKVQFTPRAELPTGPLGRYPTAGGGQLREAGVGAGGWGWGTDWGTRLGLHMDLPLPYCPTEVFLSSPLSYPIRRCVVAPRNPHLCPGLLASLESQPRCALKG